MQAAVVGAFRRCFLRTIDRTFSPRLADVPTPWMMRPPIGVGFSLLLYSVPKKRCWWCSISVAAWMRQRSGSDGMDVVGAYRVRQTRLRFRRRFPAPRWCLQRVTKKPDVPSYSLMTIAFCLRCSRNSFKGRSTICGSGTKAAGRKIWIWGGFARVKRHIWAGLWRAKMTQNFVFVFADDGEARMGGIDNVGWRWCARCCRFFKTFATAARNHRVAHFQIKEKSRTFSANT